MQISMRYAQTQRPALRLALPAWLRWPRDPWMSATLVVATLSSVGAWWYAWQNHLILLYNDAFSHLMIARRVFDNTTPGLAQLGGVWLPLPHVIMLPFIWSNALWQSGLAGSFSSMPCYILAACCVFLIARRLTHNSRASFIGALAFLLNPNVLYLQATPLSEPVLIATMTLACYAFVVWVQEQDPRWLMATGGATFLATLTRYDGWFLFAVIPVCIVAVDLLRRCAWRVMQDHLLLFAVPGGLGITLWFAWCWLIFHDPLYFQRGPYSSQTQQNSILQSGDLTTYHNLWQSFLHYFYASAETVGPAILALAIAGLALYFFRHRVTPDAIAFIPLLAPFAFYVVALFGGQAVLIVPGVVPAHASSLFFNARYGSEIVATVACAIAVLVPRRIWAQLAITGVILGQTVLVAHGGIIALQDGQQGASCTPSRPTVIFLAQHYAGGSVLEDTFFMNPEEYSIVAGFSLSQIIYQGSGPAWQTALDNPAGQVEWIITRPGDLVSTHLALGSPAFLAQFTPVAHDYDGVTLYHRIGAPLASHPVPASYVNAHQLCPNSQP